MHIIDCHTHAFPDAIAARAVAGLAQKSKPYIPHTDGTAADLAQTAARNGLDTCLICNIATKPAQVHSILRWSAEVRQQYGERLIPLASFYPKSETWESDLQLCLESDLPGLKFHPMYQDFNIDDDIMWEIYRRIAASGKFVIFHNGYDVGFPMDYDNASPQRLAKVLDKVPDLTVIASHVGGWHDWDNVEQYLAGCDVYIECSFINEVPLDILYKIFASHDPDKFLFGSDTPWLEQGKLIAYINGLDIDETFREKLFYQNAAQLLRLSNINGV